jgi:hypothetical protein
MMTPKPKQTWKADQKQASLRSVLKTTNVKNLNLKGRKKHG